MNRYKALFLVLLLLHTALLFNLRFTAWPEMFAYPYLSANGFLLYKDFIYPYPPLLTGILNFWFGVFGFSLLALKVLTWGLLLLNDLFVYRILGHIAKSERAGLIGVLFYVLLQPFLEGNMLWFDTAYVTPILIATFYTLRLGETRGVHPFNHKAYLVAAGVFFTMSVFIKQTAILFPIFALIFLLSQRIKFRELFWFFVGPLVLGVVFLAKLYTSSSFSDFVNWGIIYPMKYWSSYPGYVEMELTRTQVLTIFLLCLPVFSYLLLRRRKFLKDKQFTFLLSLFFAGLVAVYPRFSFFHFQPALAILAVLTGFVVFRFKPVLLVLLISLTIMAYKTVWPVIAWDWGKETRFYGVRDIYLAKMIEEETREGKPVYFLGLHAGLYSMANRLPPKPWSDNFGWYLEVPGVQERMLSGWEENPPEYVYWQAPSGEGAFALGNYQPKEVTGWIMTHYTNEGEITPGVTRWKKIEN